MSHIHNLIQQHCPDGVPHVRLSELVGKIRTIRWRECPDSTFKYIDLTSVEPRLHTIVDTRDITENDAPSRAQQIVQQGDVLFGTTRPMQKRYARVPSSLDGQIASTGYCVLRIVDDRMLPEFLLHAVSSTEFYNYIDENQHGASYPSISDKLVKNYMIPVPPLPVQEEIVRILDSFTKLEAELEARRQQYEHYRRKLLEGSGSVVLLGDLATNLDFRRRPITKSSRLAGSVPYYGASGVVDWVAESIFDEDLLLVSEDGANLSARSTPIAFSVTGPSWVNNHAHVLSFSDYSTRRFVEMYLNSIDLSIYLTGSTQPKLNRKNLDLIPIPQVGLELTKYVALQDPGCSCGWTV